MILAATEAIKLIPDATVFLQLIIFLFVVAVLTIFIFRPALRIIEKRRRQTSGLREQTEMLITDANAMNHDYDEITSSARRNGTAIEQRLLLEGQKEASQITADAKAKARDEAVKRRAAISNEMNAAKSDLDQKIDNYAGMIVSRILGKEGHERN